MNGLTVVTAPTAEPLTLPEVKRNLRFPVEYAYEDGRINGLITAAREYVEQHTGRALMTQTLRLTRDRFPGCDEDYVIRLPRPPLQSLTADVDNPDLGISYFDTAGTEQDLVLNTDYRVDTYSEPGRIEPLENGIATPAIGWPATDDRLNAVTVTYLAGYTSAALVPQLVKQAMHLLIKDWFEEGEGRMSDTVRQRAHSLLNMAWSGAMVGTYG